MSRLIIKSHSPARRRLQFLVLVLILGIAAWGLFEYGRYKGGYDVRAADAYRAELLQNIADERARVRELRENQAVLERSSQIEKESYRQLEGAVANLQQEILELKEELAFYRGIVSPKDGSRGLKLQDFDMTRGINDRHWRYKLVLTQVLNNDRLATGSIALEISGVRDGQPSRFGLKDLSEGDIDELTFRFKYFQDFEGDLVLPDGFEPGQVIVTIDPRGKRLDRFEETFDWPSSEES